MKKKHAKLVLALTLLSSCLTRGVPVAVPPTECLTSPWPDPPAIVFGHAPECGEDWVCITVASSIALGLWVRAVSRYHETVSGCPHISEPAPVPKEIP